MISKTAIKLAQASIEEASKEDKEYKPENLVKAIPLLRDVVKLNKQSAKTLHELMLCLQTRLLCEGKAPDSRSIKILSRKEAWIEIKDKAGTVFKIPLEDAPHELRAHLLVQYRDYSNGHRRLDINEAMRYNEYKKKGWLNPEPPQEEPEDGS